MKVTYKDGRKVCSSKYVYMKEHYIFSCGLDNIIIESDDCGMSFQLESGVELHMKDNCVVDCQTDCTIIGGYSATINAGDSVTVNAGVDSVLIGRWNTELEVVSGRDYLSVHWSLKSGIIFLARDFLKKKKIVIDGKEIMISQESYNEFKKQFKD